MQLILESVLKIKPKKTYFLSNPNSLYIKLHILIFFNKVLDFLPGEILTAFCNLHEAIRHIVYASIAFK